MMPPPSQLSMALCGLGATGPGRGDVREQIAWTRSRGITAVHLNAAAPGVRPRELDRSARRDLAALLRRSDLAFGGLDLWIPPEHYLDPAHVDRAMNTLLAAIDMAADLATLANGQGITSRVGSHADGACIGVLLPAALATDQLATIADRADRTGTRIADHTVPPRELNGTSQRVIGIGIDPASCLAAGHDPAVLASQHATRLAAARLSDLSRLVGGGRAVPGSRDGRLDVLSYTVALTTGGFSGRLALDLRGLDDADAATTAVLETLGNRVA